MTVTAFNDAKKTMATPSRRQVTFGLVKHEAFERGLVDTIE